MKEETKLDFDGKFIVKHLNQKLFELNSDTTVQQRKKFIVDEMTFHKFMTKKQATDFMNEVIRDEILRYWKAKRKENYLWGAVSTTIYETIKNNSIKDAIKILEKDREKYRNMSSSCYTQRAINDLKELVGVKNESKR